MRSQSPQILQAIGEDVERNGLLDTPTWVARMYEKMSNKPDPSLIPLLEMSMVIQKQYRFYAAHRNEKLDDKDETCTVTDMV